MTPIKGQSPENNQGPKGGKRPDAFADGLSSAPEKVSAHKWDEGKMGVHLVPYRELP